MPTSTPPTRPRSRWNRSFASKPRSGARSIPRRTAIPSHILQYVTTWVGGGSPRFWFSVSPQPKQLNYAQVLVQLTDKEITPDFVDQVQPVLTAKLPGVRCDYRQLQTNPINYPVEIRVVSEADVSTAQSAQDIAELRRIASRWKTLCAPRRKLAACATSGRRRASRSR